jgi:hypothetical protein
LFTCIIPPLSGLVSTTHHLSDHHNTRSTSNYTSTTTLSKQQRDQPHTQTTLYHYTTSMIRYHNPHTPPIWAKPCTYFVLFVFEHTETYPYSYEFLFTHFLPVSNGRRTGGQETPHIYTLPGAFAAGLHCVSPTTAPLNDIPISFFVLSMIWHLIEIVCSVFFFCLLLLFLMFIWRITNGYLGGMETGICSSHHGEFGNTGKYRDYGNLGIGIGIGFGIWEGLLERQPGWITFAWIGCIHICLRAGGEAGCWAWLWVWGCMRERGLDSDMAGLLREGMMMVGGEGSVNLTGWNELWILPEIYEYYDMCIDVYVANCGCTGEKWR